MTLDPKFLRKLSAMEGDPRQQARHFTREARHAADTAISAVRALAEMIAWLDGPVPPEMLLSDSASLPNCFGASSATDLDDKLVNRGKEERPFLGSLAGRRHDPEMAMRVYRMMAGKALKRQAQTQSSRALQRSLDEPCRQAAGKFCHRKQQHPSLDQESLGRLKSYQGDRVIVVPEAGGDMPTPELARRFVKALGHGLLYEAIITKSGQTSAVSTAVRGLFASGDLTTDSPRLAAAAWYETALAIDAWETAREINRHRVALMEQHSAARPSGDENVDPVLAAGEAIELSERVLTGLVVAEAIDRPVAHLAAKTLFNKAVEHLYLFRRAQPLARTYDQLTARTGTAGRLFVSLIAHADDPVEESLTDDGNEANHEFAAWVESLAAG